MKFTVSKEELERVLKKRNRKCGSCRRKSGYHIPGKVLLEGEPEEKCCGVCRPKAEFPRTCLTCPVHGFKKEPEVPKMPEEIDVTREDFDVYMLTSTINEVIRFHKWFHGSEGGGGCGPGGDVGSKVGSGGGC